MIGTNQVIQPVNRILREHESILTFRGDLNLFGNLSGLRTASARPARGRCRWVCDRTSGVHYNSVHTTYSDSASRLTDPLRDLARRKPRHERDDLHLPSRALDLGLADNARGRVVASLHEHVRKELLDQA